MNQLEPNLAFRFIQMRLILHGEGLLGLKDEIYVNLGEKTAVEIVKYLLCNIIDLSQCLSGPSPGVQSLTSATV